MKRIILITVMVFGFVRGSWGQEGFEISFEKDKIEVERNIKDSIIVPVNVRVDIKDVTNKANYSLNIETDDKKSTLPKSDYKLYFKKADFDKLESFTALLILNKDSLADRERSLVLRFKIYKDGEIVDKAPNTGAIKEMTIVVKNAHSPLKDYKYLSYVGTNFDLVEGIKAENLFFATNIFSQPTTGTRDFGIYLSLYGNRTVSLKEDLGVRQIITEIVPVSQDSSYRVRKHVQTERTTQSDNLGAHISTLHPIFGSRNKTKGVKTYFTGSADFIWQRKHVLTEYGEVSQIDTLKTASTGHSVILNDLQNKRISVNQYIFNIGPGLFFNIEDNNVSVRVHMAVGYTSTFFNVSRREDEFLYDRKHDIYFAGRAWITEPQTGITLQAEIMNQLIEPRPYYVVTLSKAFHLDKLAGIFSPVTSRK
jgi:hypothetical protein